MSAMPRMFFSPLRHRKVAASEGSGYGFPGNLVDMLESYSGLHFALACDVLVAGSNPLLNVLVARKAIAAGDKVVLWNPIRQDNWNYWLFQNAKAREYVTRKTGASLEPTEDPFVWAGDIVASILRSIGAMAGHSGGKLYLFNGADGLSVRSDMGDELCLTTAPGETVRLSENTIQIAMERGLWNYPRGTRLLSRAGLDSKRRQYIFAKQVILSTDVLGNTTSKALQEMAQIRRIGSALRMPETQEQAFQFPLEDIMEFVQ